MSKYKKQLLVSRPSKETVSRNFCIIACTKKVTDLTFQFEGEEEIQGNETESQSHPDQDTSNKVHAINNVENKIEDQIESELQEGANLNEIQGVQDQKLQK